MVGLGLPAAPAGYLQSAGICVFIQVYPALLFPEWWQPLCHCFSSLSVWLGGRRQEEGTVTVPEA